MQTSRDLYALKKRFAYLLAFVELVKAKFRRKLFRKPEFDAASLDHHHHHHHHIYLFTK